MGGTYTHTSKWQTEQSDYIVLNHIPLNNVIYVDQTLVYRPTSYFPLDILNIQP